MTIGEEFIKYRDGETNCEGFLCYDAGRTGPLPAVLISHAWAGRDEFVARKARRLAWHGYAAFALDMYGDARQGKTTAENRALMDPFMADRAMLARRITAALTTVRALPQVDPKRIAAMGFCFGGLCVLDLARSGADIRGVASFHGLLKPTGLPVKPITSKILVMHGYDDPMAPPDEVLALGKELTAAGADWQVHAYGRTVHAFTNPGARDAAMGTVYNANADRRSWHSLLNFFEEVLR
ncbi:MAG: dienelactone hydrolase family protein [Candidatus Obscuribacterales bacterium]|nr:dienelactone hydrolase family protein [Steroidobacteraceae bacterium]